MSLFSRLNGVINSFFQIGGPTGSGFNDNAGILEAKDSSNSTFVVVRGDTPINDNDLTTKAYVDTIFKPIPVTAQSIAASALIANTATEHYIVVTTAGTGAAAAYVLGTILWDDGSGAGDVTILGPTIGNEIVTTAAFTGGTITLSANQNYVWDGSTWVNVSPSVAGAVFEIDMPITTSASQSSTTSIPAGAIVTRATSPSRCCTRSAAPSPLATRARRAYFGDGRQRPSGHQRVRSQSAHGVGGVPLAVLVTVGGASAGRGS